MLSKNNIFIILTALVCTPIAIIAREASFHDKALSCLASSAIGDVLGRVTEFLPSVDAQFQKYPHGVQRIEDFKPSDWNGLPAAFQSKHIAPYTDDTRMALLVCEALAMPHTIEKGRDHTMAAIAKNFMRDLDDQTYGWAASYRAPGNRCLKSVRYLKSLSTSQKQHPRWWDVRATEGGGCGSVMRAHPFGIAFYNNPGQAKLRAVEHSKITHGHPISLAACAAMAVGTAHALQGTNTHAQIIEQMIIAADEYDHGTAEKMRTAVGYADQAKLLLGNNDIYTAFKDKPFRAFHEKVFTEFQGWAAHDAIAAAIYLFALFETDIDAALYTGIHTPGDSDSIAAMAGALIGAYSGTLPSNVPLDAVEDADRIKELAHALSTRMSIQEVSDY